MSSTFLWCCLIRLVRWLYLFEFVDEILTCDHSFESLHGILNRKVEQYVPVALFIVMYKACASMGEILTCDHSHKGAQQTDYTYVTIREVVETTTRKGPTKPQNRWWSLPTPRPSSTSKDGVFFSQPPLYPAVIKWQ